MSYYSILRTFIVCCQVFSLVSGAVIRNQLDESYRLMEFLTNNSAIRKQLLPVRDINKPVNVEIRIRLRQIAGVDEKNQAIRVVVWLRLQWFNPFLTWDPADYGGIKTVHADNNLLWVPDVALFNEASLDDEIEILHKRILTKLIVTNDGHCIWNSPITLNSQCRIDVARFPFDEQQCRLQIGSWTYSGHKINMTYIEKNADMADFIRNGEWDVKSAILSYHFTYYGPEHVPYPDITLTLKIKRRSLYYGVQIIIPLAVISLLALLNICLPVDNAGLISNLITLVVAIAVYAIIISSKLPETSDDVPVLEIYCLGNLLTVTLTWVHGALMLKFASFSSHDKPMTKWYRVATKWIGKILCVKGCNNLPKGNENIELKTLKNNDETKNDDLVETVTRTRRFSSSSTVELVNNIDDATEAEKWRMAEKVFRRFFLIFFFSSWVGFHAYLVIELAL